jgi:hypothetical protein
MSAMKKLTRALLLLSASASALHAESNLDSDGSEKIRYQLILPEEKTPEVVKPNEPNPFNKSDGNILKPEDASSEENKVKDALMNMRVSGVAMNGDGSIRAVMLGEMKLERGQIVPQVVPDQEVHLRVNSLSESTIELFWIEKKKNISLPPRPVIIPVNLKPFVRYMLPGASAAAAAQKLLAGPDRALGYQTAPGTTASVPPSTEQRRAILANEAPQIAADPPAPAQEPVKQQAADEKHPANLLMNLLLQKAVPTQQPQAPASAK